MQDKKNKYLENAYDLVQKWRDTPGTALEIGFEGTVAEVAKLLERAENRELDTSLDSLIEGENKESLLKTDTFHRLANRIKELESKVKLLTQANEDLRCKEALDCSVAKVESNRIKELEKIKDILQETCDHYEMEIGAWQSRVKELENREMELIEDLDWWKQKAKNLADRS